MKDYTGEAIIAGLGILGSLVTYWQTKRKSNAEIDQIVVNSVKSITDEFKDLISLVKQDSVGQREHRNRCESDIAKLRRDSEKIKRVCKSDCFNIEK